MNHYSKKILKNFYLLLIALLTLCAETTVFAGGSGALCLYQDSEGIIVCTSYGNSGVAAEADCASNARASNPQCGMDVGAINAAAGSCASQIFGSPSRCLDDVAPHNLTGALDQATCEGAGDRWCPSTYYGFFVGNTSCQDAICAAAFGILPVELINFQGRIDGEFNYLSWTTASEYNSSHFVLSHYSDSSNIDWQIVIAAAGNSTEVIDYAAKHQNPEKQANYYMLTQVDIDGVTMNYGPIMVDNREVKRNLVKTVNTMGQEVDEYYKGIIIEIYDDGSTVKAYRQ